MDSPPCRTLLFLSFVFLLHLISSHPVCVPRNFNYPIPPLSVPLPSTGHLPAAKKNLTPASAPVPCDETPSPVSPMPVGHSTSPPHSTSPKPASPKPKARGSASPPSVVPPHPAHPSVPDTPNPYSTPNSGYQYTPSQPYQPVQPSIDPNTAVMKICNATDYPPLCLEVATSLTGKIDVMTLLTVSVSTSAKLTKSAVSIAEKFIYTPGTPLDKVDILKDCKNSYEEALDNFQTALNALGTGDMGTANSMLSAIITNVGDCDDEFSGQASPLFIYAEKVTKMTSNCLAIGSLIHN